MVVYAGMGEDAEHRPAAAFGIRRAPDYRRWTSQYDSPRAHWAWLFCDIEPCVCEPPVAFGGKSGFEGEHFGVGCGVGQRFGLVVGKTENDRLCGIGIDDGGVSVVRSLQNGWFDNDAASRDFPGLCGL